MNWGKGLVLGLASFMGFVIFLVVLMFRAPDDSFDKDYYEKGLAYDEEYNQKKQVLIDSVAPAIKLEGEDGFSIEFSAIDSGKLRLIRPSNHLEDKEYVLSAKRTIINTQKLNRGEWNLSIQWKANQKDYLFEKNLFIP
jgi:hypothetical protein